MRPLSRICRGCGIDFIATKANKQYCSEKCHWGEQTCEHCKEKYIKRIQTRWCNRECQKAATTSARRSYVSHEGYRIIYLGGKRKIAEHRLIMQESIGRELRDDETVHHINGDRLDNKIENLQLRSGQHGAGVKRVCLDCGSSNILATEI